jgi:t-SNARE complex subunit (syntaxin)
MTFYNRDVEIIKEIEKEVEYVKDITEELNQLIYKQKIPINDLENSMMNIKCNINKSENNFQSADDDNNSNNKKKILVGLTSGILLTSLIVGPYITIPIGLICIGSYVYISK